MLTLRADAVVAPSNPSWKLRMPGLFYSDTAPEPNPEEVASYRYVSLEDLEYELKQYPANFTVWFRICFQEVKDKLTTLQYA